VLLTARPQAFADWLDLPAPLAAADGVGELVAGLVPAGRGVDLRAQLPLRHAVRRAQLEGGDALLSALQGPVSGLALLQDPASLLEEAGHGDGPDLWGSLVCPLLHQALSGLSGPLPALVASADPGPLLGIRREDGWMLGTPADSPSADQLGPALKEQGYTPAPLDRAGQTLEVWTRLEARSGKGDPDRLQATVAGARLDQGGIAWWGDGLAALDDQLQGRAAPRERLEQLRALGMPRAPLQAALAGPVAQRLLAPWHPWQILSSLAGRPLTDGVQGLALGLEVAAVEPEPTEVPEPSTTLADPSALLELHARVQLG
jgi:hypothetical protein